MVIRVTALCVLEYKAWAFVIKGDRRKGKEWWISSFVYWSKIGPSCLKGIVGKKGERVVWERKETVLLLMQCCLRSVCVRR